MALRALNDAIDAKGGIEGVPRAIRDQVLTTKSALENLMIETGRVDRRFCFLRVQTLFQKPHECSEPTCRYAHVPVVVSDGNCCAARQAMRNEMKAPDGPHKRTFWSCCVSNQTRGTCYDAFHFGDGNNILEHAFLLASQLTS